MSLMSGLVVCAVAAAIWLLCLVTANVCIFAMARHVRRVKPDGTSLMFPGFAYSKSVKILEEYRSLYPGKLLPRCFLGALAVAAAAFGVIFVIGVSAPRQH